MCRVIVDAHFIHEVVSKTCCQDLLPIRTAIMQRKLTLVYGGTKLRKEFASVQSQIASLDRAGRASLMPQTDVDQEEMQIEESPHLTSNDAHIIAIARVSGSRLLCTNDKKLQTDFKNLNLLSSPKGNVYKNESHKHLIRKPCSESELMGHKKGRDFGRDAPG